MDIGAGGPGKNPARKKVFAKYMQEKLAVTVLVIMLALFALVMVLYKIVDENNEDYTRVVLSQRSTYDSRTILYRRGDIVDRNGTYLATSDKVYNLILDPGQIYEKEEYYLDPTVNALAEIFGYSRNELLETMNDNRESRYLRYERRMTYEKKEAFEALQNSFNEENYKEGKNERIRGYGLRMNTRGFTHTAPWHAMSSGSPPPTEARETEGLSSIITTPSSG